MSERCKFMVTKSEQCRYRAAVRGFCRRHDPESERRAKVTARYREAHELREQGWTYKAIGEHFKVSAVRARTLVRLSEKRDA